MATLVTTALARRSSGTTTFTPLGIENGIGYLGESGAFQRQSPSMTISKKTSAGNRRTSQVRFSLPQVDTTIVSNPTVVRTATIDVIITVPDGYPTALVNDLVGWAEKALAKPVTNIDDLLVTGAGVF